MKDTYEKEVYETVEAVSDAFEIIDQYILEKDILPQNDPDMKILASELLKRLINRFRGEI